MPCPEGVQVRTLMTLESFIKRFPRERIVTGFADAVASHDACTSCGECEEKCPYDLPIRETMPAMVTRFHDYTESAV